EQGERPLHLGEAVRIAEQGAGVAAVAERARGLGQAERLGERRRLVGGGDRLGVSAGDGLHSRKLRVGINERRAGRLRLEQRDRLGRERDLPALAEGQGDAGAELERSGGGFRLAAGTETLERL